jgi:hypothetical protein
MGNAFLALRRCLELDVFSFGVSLARRSGKEDRINSNGSKFLDHYI